jgi:DNA-binding response OmpR family regulator
MTTRRVPLIVVASESSAVTESVAAELRRQGNVVYAAHSADGCLRVATSVGPDIVLLDPALPERLEQLLKAHPTSASAEILHLAAGGVRAALTTARSVGVTPSPATAGPHAA